MKGRGSDGGNEGSFGWDVYIYVQLKGWVYRVGGGGGYLFVSM